MNKLWFLGGFFALVLALVIFSVANAGQVSQPAGAAIGASDGNVVSSASCGCGDGAPCGGNCGALGKTCQCGGACQMNKNVGQQ